MRFIIYLMFVSLMLVTDVLAQTTSGSSSQSSSKNRVAEATLKTMRGRLRNSGDQLIARNLMIVKTVADYKMGDEKYASDFEDLESNREYNEKINKILNNLNNKKIKNTKNRAVINILNEAGSKLYNLLAN